MLFVSGGRQVQGRTGHMSGGRRRYEILQTRTLGLIEIAAIGDKNTLSKGNDCRTTQPPRERAFFRHFRLLTIFIGAWSPHAGNCRRSGPSIEPDGPDW